jgi:hypothetical protein
LAGWVGTWFIRGRGLESDDWEGDDDQETDEEAGSNGGEQR